MEHLPLQLLTRSQNHRPRHNVTAATFLQSPAVIVVWRSLHRGRLVAIGASNMAGNVLKIVQRDIEILFQWQQWCV